MFKCIRNQKWQKGGSFKNRSSQLEKVAMNRIKEKNQGYKEGNAKAKGFKGSVKYAGGGTKKRKKRKKV